MGKNFSCNNQGQRRESDYYETPFSMTQQLLEQEPFDEQKTFLEPCCGARAIAQYLPNCTAYDLREGHDFLLEQRQFHYIITNPPFSKAFEFIKHCKKVATDKFALLLPLSYLHGQQRYESGIFQGLKTVYVFTRYPMLGDALREDGKYRTGMMVYAWYIWEIGWLQPAIIQWLNNQPYIIKRRDS
jgi:hypothetical protein